MRTQHTFKSKIKPTLTANHVVQWDWKEEPPMNQIHKLARQYPYQYSTTLGEDQAFMFFTHSPIRNDRDARVLLGWA
jgi:hypothetical protein